VWDVTHIDRGYPRFIEDSRVLGADIERVTADPVR
jgi:UDP-N-acetylglucosamine 1-carboxyvinyltransferase